jgi:hypothetical protein
MIFVLRPVDSLHDMQLPGTANPNLALPHEVVFDNHHASCSLHRSAVDPDTAGAPAAHTRSQLVFLC